MSRRIVSLSIAIAAMGWLTAGEAKAQMSERPFVEHVQSLLLREAEALRSRGYEPTQKALINQTARSEIRRVVVRLQQGISYAMLAACDQDCRHVELSIFDANRELMLKSRDRNDVVVVTGAPDRSGLYEVEIGLPGCREPSCHVGFVVLQQGSEPLAGGVVVATSIVGAPPTDRAPPGGPAVASAMIGMERRQGVEVMGTNYLELRNTTLAACETRCAGDDRCRAVEYYVERGSCGLFDHLPGMRRARGIDTSIKRTAGR